MTQSLLFDDGKDPQAFRTIGEVSAALGIKPHVLRYWEEQFDMLRPVKRSGGRRYYRPEDIELLRTIDRLLNQEGYTVRGAARALKEGDVTGDRPAMPQLGDDDSASAPSGTPENGDLASRLQAIREKLARGLDEDS